VAGLLEEILILQTYKSREPLIPVIIPTLHGAQFGKLGGSFY
jgi:hypothetical protein